jgi:hypothetical protein
MWGIGHLLELISSISIGKKARINTNTAVLKTLLLGFIWWLPVKMGMLEK